MERKKIALMFVCLNTPYWPYVKQIIEDAKVHFLKNHDVDILVWTDMPELESKELETILSQHKSQTELPQTLADHIIASFNEEFAKANKGLPMEIHNFQRALQQSFLTVGSMVTKESVLDSVKGVRDNVPKENIFHTEPVSWPYPTLMRYHLFLQQEEILKKYDYLFYLDSDMRMVDTITEEILGDGLTMAEHPMYALRREYVPPYEPNPESKAFIARMGMIVQGEKKYFKPLYAAGGFQGGKADLFIEAMKVMKKNIDSDFNKNYTAIWNDESHWNKYLSTFGGSLIALDPSYIYPDSLIAEYYEKIWGRSYKPKIITLTKRFSTNLEGGDAVQKQLKTM